MKRSTLSLLSLFISICITQPTLAITLPLPHDGGRLIGNNVFYKVENNGGSLEDIARKFNVGLLALKQANPGVDPFLPRPGSVLTIPGQLLLPDEQREGIVINLAELRLYFYPPGKNEVTIYPIGIGQLGGTTVTPTMITRVSEKRQNPTWTPTANIRARYRAMGIELPAVVPAGPDNPMGLYAIRLAAFGGVYLIHGTNADFGIGMRVTSGCIRLRDDDIQDLFNRVAIGTRVNIITAPVKIAVEPNGLRWVEVHQPLSLHIDDDPRTTPIILDEQMGEFKRSVKTDGAGMSRAITYRFGMPVNVTK